MIYDIIRQRRNVILKQWGEATLKNYGVGGIKYDRPDNDRFTNPVQYTVQNSLSIILDELIERIHTARLDSSLEDIVKIRSLQTEKPSEALDFIFELKRIVKTECGGSKNNSGLPGELEEFENTIDNLLQTAFDIFMQSREKIYEIRKNEVLRRSYKLLERANMTAPSKRKKGVENE